MIEPGVWVITWRGKQWTEDDLTGAHAALVTLLSGSDEWAMLDPFKGPVTLMQIMAAFISIDERRDALEVVGELGCTPLKQLLSAVSIE